MYTIQIVFFCGAARLCRAGPLARAKSACSKTGYSCKLTSRLCYLQLPNHSALVLSESSSVIPISNLHPVQYFIIVYTDTRGSRWYVFRYNHLSVTHLSETLVNRSVRYIKNSQRMNEWVNKNL